MFVCKVNINNVKTKQTISYFPKIAHLLDLKHYLCINPNYHIMMKKIATGLIGLLFAIPGSSQPPAAGTGPTTFRGYFFNQEYNVYIRLDAYAQNIVVPGQEVYGELPGFLGDRKDSRKWLFTGSKITGASTLSIDIINDYGSEDLNATLTRENDSTFVLKQGAGSTLKIARNRKWVKLPKKMTFIKKPGENKDGK